jgi:Zn-dependent protease
MSHGLAAYFLGDKTAQQQKRISLNPLRHIDPIGLLMLIVFRFGWAKPVSVDMRNFKNPKRGMALSALAGPVSNILLSCLLFFIIGLLFRALYTQTGSAGNLLLEFLDMTARLSIFLGVFNLIPIPPLDGSKVLFAFLPDSAYAKLMAYERYGMFLLIALMLSGVLGGPLNRLFAVMLNWLNVFTQAGYSLAGLF